MKKNEIENRSSETKDISTIVERSMNSIQEEITKLENYREESFRILGEVNNFSKETLENLSKIQEDERLKYLESTLQKLKGWSQAEADRIKNKHLYLQERITTLVSIKEMLDTRFKAYELKITAMNRVLDPNADKKHPEKLAIKRNAVEDSQDS